VSGLLGAGGTTEAPTEGEKKRRTRTEERLTREKEKKKKGKAKKQIWLQGHASFYHSYRDPNAELLPLNLIILITTLPDSDQEKAEQRKPGSTGCSQLRKMINYSALSLGLLSLASTPENNYC
jgi:hypothetical protein